MRLTLWYLASFSLVLFVFGVGSYYAMRAASSKSSDLGAAVSPTNLSRLEIASELSVSPNTVSTHIRSIYAKLGVRDRSSAVQRARELRLLAVGRTR